MRILVFTQNPHLGYSDYLLAQRYQHHKTNKRAYFVELVQGVQNAPFLSSFVDNGFG